LNPIDPEREYLRSNFPIADHPPGTSFFASCNQDLRALVVYAKKSRRTNRAACLSSTYL